MRSMKSNQFTAAMMVVVAFALSACGSLSPLSHAQTVEQKAYAVYGEFVVIEEQAAAVVQSAEVPVNVRKAVADADTVAKPIADALLNAAATVKKVQAEIAVGQSTEEKLVIATANLQKWVDELGPALQNLVSAVRGAHK